jgi:hypothetical protein
MEFIGMVGGNVGEVVEVVVEGRIVLLDRSLI